MSGFIRIEGCDHWLVSNKGLFDFIMGLQEVGKDMASGEYEEKCVESLENWTTYGYFNGADFDLNERFPTADEMEFWDRVCVEYAKRLYNREIEGHLGWKLSQIGFAMYSSTLMYRYARLQNLRDERARKKS